MGSCFDFGDLTSVNSGYRVNFGGTILSSNGCRLATFPLPSQNSFALLVYLASDQVN